MQISVKRFWKNMQKIKMKNDAEKRMQIKNANDKSKKKNYFRKKISVSSKVRT